MSIFNKKSQEVEKNTTVATPIIKADKKGSETEKVKGYGTAHRILLRPIISEKATIAHSENKYIFEVALKANKIEVKKAIEEVYGLVPSAVNMINQDGKTVRSGRGRTKNYKKAIVTLKKGDSITIYEGI